MQTTINAQGQTEMTVDWWGVCRAIALTHSIRLWRDFKMVTVRGLTISRQFEMATEFTLVVYKRGQYDRVLKDLDDWISEMKAAFGVKA